MKKRILPALLALCMVMSLLPSMAFAAAGDACACDDASQHSSTQNKCDQKLVDGDEKVCSSCTDHNYTGKDDGSDDKEETPDPEEPDDSEEPTVYYCACTKVDLHVQNVAGQEVKKCPNTVAEEGQLCASCARDAAHNPCGVGSCDLLKGHTGNHNNESCLSANDTEKARCGAATHNDGCPNKCDLSAQGYTAPAGGDVGDKGDEDEPVGQADAADEPAAWETGDTQKCTLTVGHSGPHSNTQCIKDAKCGAESHAPDCPVASASGQCGKGGCDKAKGHTGEHNNNVCLGTANDKNCKTGLTHIAGCPKYSCECEHEYTKVNKKYEEGLKIPTAECTSAAGCALCNEWNSFVTSLKAAYNKQKAAYDAYQALSDAEKEKTEAVEDPGSVPSVTPCTCAVCKPNPVTGVVEGETVTADPANPSTDPETPTKAEDFTDMEDWMAADVQVVLDNGWMEGIGESKFDGRADSTGEMVATVIARMLGADVKGGAEWKTSLNTWLEENKDLVEGIEITNGAMTRKDVILMLWRQADKPDSDFELAFDDVDGLEGDYLTAMKWAAEKGIVKGNGDGTVSPDGNVKRAELAAFAARYYALEK